MLSVFPGGPSVVGLLFSRVRSSCDDGIVLSKRQAKFVVGYAWLQDGGL